MRTSAEQREIEKQLKLIARLYEKIDGLKAENKKLKKSLKIYKAIEAMRPELK